MAAVGTPAPKVGNVKVSSATVSSTKASSAKASNAKGELIAACRSQGLGDPGFASESGGPGHAPWFRTTVTLGERELGHGEGRSKRDAERAASLDALKTLAPATELRATELQPAEPRTPTLAKSVARWPIYAEVLSQALLVAHERNEQGALADVGQDAAELYRALLGELGHTPEAPRAPETPQASETP